MSNFTDMIRRQWIIENHGYDLKDGTITFFGTWRKSFALFPRKTISNRWVWLTNAYSRRVRVYTGFVDEPKTQWGTLFDVMHTL